MWGSRRKRTRQRIVESQQALLDAHRAVGQAQAREQEVHTISKTLKDIRERNHFAEQLRIIMEGG